MNNESPGALFEALRLLELPSGVPAARTRRFPDDVGLLIRLLAGDEASLEQARQQHPAAAEVLLDAAEFYLLQVCFTPGVDSYRVLGVNRDQPLERIREHYRLLVRWLHPDRNSDAWQTVYLDRVNQAWRDLRHPPERARYDQDLPETATADAVVPVTGVPAFAQVAAAKAPGLRTLSARTMHRLPARVLAALGVAAALALGWFYLDQPDRRETPVSQAVDEPAASPSPARFRTGPPPIPTPSEPVEVLPMVAAPANAQRAEDSPAAAARFSGGALVVSSTLPAAAEPKVSTPQTSQHSATPGRPGKLAGGPSQAQSPTVARTAPTIAVAEAPASAPPLAPPPTDDAADRAAASVIAASSATPAAPADRVDPMAVQMLLAQFQRAYGAGDLIRLMALFTRDARNRPQAQGLLADEYRALFESSRARSLSLSHVNWWQETGGLAVVASFEAAVTPLDSHRERLSTGDIYFELRREGDVVRIASVRHQENQR